MKTVNKYMYVLVCLLGMAPAYAMQRSTQNRQNRQNRRKKTPAQQEQDNLNRAMALSRAAQKREQDQLKRAIEQSNQSKQEQEQFELALELSRVDIKNQPNQVNRSNNSSFNQDNKLAQQLQEEEDKRAAQLEQDRNMALRFQPKTGRNNTGTSSTTSTRNRRRTTTTTPKKPATKRTTPKQSTSSTTSTQHKKKPVATQKPATESQFDVPCELQNKRFTHLQSKQQSKFTCGWWTLANALALQQLMNKNLPINAANIKTHAQINYNQMWKKHPNNNKTGWLLGDKLTEIARSMQLTNLFIVTKYQPTAQDRRNGTAKQVNFSNPFNNQTINQLIGAIEQQGQGIVNFAYFNVNHWILMSMIKERGKPRRLVYLDSQNLPLEFYRVERPDVIQLVESVYNRACT